MKRTALSILFACCTLALAAQGFRVNFKGEKPTIADLAWAFCQNAYDDEETGDHPSDAIQQALEQRRKGLPQDKGVTLVVDEKNGYLLYEDRYEEDPENVYKMEMCFWNEADGKHKLFAFNNLAAVNDGKPVMTEVSDLLFFRYDNATKRMAYCEAPGFEVDYGCTYSLPRTGKDIIVTKWGENGKTSKSTLKWNGRRFSK